MATSATDIRNFKDSIKLELQNIFSYWSNKMVDNENGGFYGRRDENDQLVEQAPKGIILNTRILWAFSHAYRNLKNPVYLDLANRSYHYLLNHFLDKKNGGMYWMVDYQGKPTETKKQIYAQAFAIYALSEYFMITAKQESLDIAVELFKLIEKYSLDHKKNGYLEAFDKEWNLLEDLRLSDKDANEKKTMNTHLHILEAYTNLFRVWKDKNLEKQLKNLIVLFRDTIIDKDTHFQLFFDEDWNVKSEEISYGHDIEGSWLLDEAVEVLHEKNLLSEIEKTAVKMVDQTIKKGLDADGGLMNEGNEHGLTDTDKHWWPQAEALVGLVNAWQITGDTKYLETAGKIWSFILEKLLDKKNSEWYWGVTRGGALMKGEDKAGPWKGPYHNGRALIEVLNRLK